VNLRGLGLWIIFAVIIGLTGSQARSDEAARSLARIDEQQRLDFERGENVALVVGVSNYPAGSGLRALKYADDDAEEIGRQLISLGFKTKVLMNHQATRRVILNAIKEQGQLLESDTGTFLFVFSGHGFADSTQTANYIAPYEAGSDSISRTGIALRDLLAALRETGARRRVAFIDACRTDPGEEGSKGGSGKGTFVELDDTEGEAILLASKSGFPSWEYSELGGGHGVFSYYVIKGLAGEAVGPDGIISFNALAGYVRKSVKDYTVNTLKKNYQMPYVAGERSGDFVLAKASASPVLAAGYSNQWLWFLLLITICFAGNYYFRTNRFAWIVPPPADPGRTQPVSPEPKPVKPRPVKTRETSDPGGFTSSTAVGYLCRTRDKQVIAAIEPGQSLSIGRSSRSDVVLDNDAISARHATVRWHPDSDSFWLQDCDSTNGAWIEGGTPLASGKKISLEAGNIFYLGRRSQGFYIIRPARLASDRNAG